MLRDERGADLANRAKNNNQKRALVPKPGKATFKAKA